MSCNCGKNEKLLQIDKVIKMATTESNIEQENYVIYEIEGKITYDRKSCWEKAGKPGKLERIVFPV